MVPKFVEDFHNITTQLCPKLCEEVQSTKIKTLFNFNYKFRYIFFQKFKNKNSTSYNIANNLKITEN